MALQMILLLIILAIPLIPTFWAILDIPKRRFQTSRSKVLWFLTVSSLPCIGALLYIAFGRRHTEPKETQAQSL